MADLRDVLVRCILALKLTIVTNEHARPGHRLIVLDALLRRDRGT